MAIVTTQSKHYQNIADAIRTHSGQTASYTPSEMPEAIEKVYDAGHAMGYETGYAIGHTDGFDYGEENYRSFFWDKYQQEGERTDYNFAFCGSGWTEDVFWPRHDINVHSGYQTFAYCGFAGSLKQRLEMCKVKLQFQGNVLLMSMFAYAAGITELGHIDFGSVTANGSNTYVFGNCTSLHTIEKLTVPVGQAVWTGWFDNCSALENIRFAGVIVHGGLNFSGSPRLTRDSMLSLFACLADKNGASGTFKITLGDANLAKLTAEDKAIATNKGWTLA